LATGHSTSTKLRECDSVIEIEIYIKREIEREIETVGNERCLQIALQHLDR